MTRERVRAGQTDLPFKGIRALQVTVTAINASTVTVALPGGGTVTAPRGAGWTYTVGGTGWALMQEPALIAVIPTVQ